MLCRYPANLCVVKESDVVFKKFTNGCVRVVNRWLPDAFLFAIILTLIVFVAAMCATGMGPVEVIAKWGDAKGGFWNLLAFSMQMALVLVFGYLLAGILMKPFAKVTRAIEDITDGFQDEKISVPDLSACSAVKKSTMIFLKSWKNSC